MSRGGEELFDEISDLRVRERALRRPYDPDQIAARGQMRRRMREIARELSKLGAKGAVDDWFTVRMMRVQAWLMESEP